MRAAIALCILIAAAPASADRAKAEQYFRAGSQAFKLQSYAAAAENFEAAFHELQIPEIAFSAAQAYRRQFFITPQRVTAERAIELYRFYLDHVTSGGRVGDAADGLAEMKRELERLPAGGSGKLDVAPRNATRLAISVMIEGEARQQVTELSLGTASDTLGAQATLDGKPAKLYVPVDVSPGEHVIEVTAPGYFPIQVKRVAVEGASDVVEAELKPKPARLALHVEDGATISLDGKPVGTAPLAPQDVPAGHHVVTISRRGREPVVQELALTKDQQRVLDVQLQHTAKRRAVPWLFAGAGGLAVVSGVTAAFALSYDSKLSKLQQQRDATGITADQLSQLNRDASHRDDYRDAAWAFGGAAAVTALVAAGLYWFDVPQPSERAIAPVVTSSGAGVSLVGWF